MTRRKLTPMLESRLERYYGGKICVVSGGEEDDSAVDWAHLDDNNRNTVFENLAPLSHTYNRLQEEWRRNQSAHDPRIPLAVDLQSTVVRHRAHKQFQLGRPALAVGACWLAVHLAEKYPNEFGAEPGEEWAHLAQTLFYLPYRMEESLLRALVRKTCVYVAQCGRPTPEVKSSLLLSFANLYQDMNVWDRAEEIHEFLHRHLPDDHPTRAAMLRRRSVSALVKHGATPTCIYRLDQAADANPSLDFLTAVAIARAWIFLNKGNATEALKVLDLPWERCHGKPRELMRYLSPHNVFELALTRAAAYQQLCRSSSQEARVLEAAKMKMPQTQLRAIFSENIFPTLASSELAVQGRKIGTKLAPMGDLLLLMQTAVTGLLSLRSASSSSSRRTGWAD